MIRTLAPQLSLLLFVQLAPCGAAAGAEDAAKPPSDQGTRPILAWMDATNDLAGDAWSADGVTAMAVVPGVDQVVAGVCGKGLYGSTNRGTSWAKLGSIADAKFRPIQIVIAASDADSWWVANSLGSPGLFTTADGGKTFKGLGNVDGLDSIAVDQTDVKHALVLLGTHERERDIEVSTNGGMFFSKVGKLPPTMGYTSQVAIVDAKTWLVSAPSFDKTSKKAKDKDVGIWRSEDAGKSWSRVGEVAGTGPALVASSGAIYWPASDGESVLRGNSRGSSWASLPASVKTCPIELPKRLLAALGDRQLLITSDGGDSWDAVGPKLPFQPQGVVYDAPGHCFFAWRSSAAYARETIMRLDVPDDLGRLIHQLVPRDIVAWDGEGHAGINGIWTNADASVTVQSTDVRQGKSAILWHVAMKAAYANCGWYWFASPTHADAEITDASACSTFLASIKITGAAKPTKAQVILHSQDSASVGKSASADVELMTYCPKLLDGEWHEVQIPLSAFAATGFDPKKLCYISFKAEDYPNPLNFDLVVDAIGFGK